MQEVLRVKIVRLGGERRLDIRRCLVSKNGAIPTKRGFSIPEEMIEELLEKIEKANGKEEFLPLP